MDFSDLNHFLHGFNSCASIVYEFVPCPRQGIERQAVVVQCARVELKALIFFCPYQVNNIKPPEGISSQKNVHPHVFKVILSVLHGEGGEVLGTSESDLWVCCE